MPESSIISSPTLLAAAALLCQPELPKFSDVASLRTRLRADARQIMQKVSEKSRPAVGVLEIATILRGSNRQQIEAVLLGAQSRSTLGELPAAVDLQTPCSSEALSRFTGNL